MKKQFVIVYQPNRFSAILDPEFIIPVIIIQIIALTFIIVKNMFVEDLIGAIALGFFPIIIFGLVSLVWFPFCCFKLVFDYKNMIFIKQTIFYKKVYNLNEIDMKKQYRKSGDINTNIPILVITYKDKKVCEINGETFEQLTRFSINHILD